MSDQLKQYVEDRREEFELYPLDVNAGWQEIANRVAPVKPSRPIKPWMAIAASISLLLVGALIGIRMYTAAVPVSASAEFEDMQFYYQEMVDAKLQLVRARVEDPEILADFDMMDEAFAELKADLDDNVANAEVLEAMIDSYQLKLQILERILEELEDESHEEQTNI
ncbi:MAG: hypothetical protein AAGA85_04260 [Bacteroidota bacterium]